MLSQCTIIKVSVQLFNRHLLAFVFLDFLKFCRRTDCLAKMKANPAQLYEKGFKAELLYAELGNALRIVTFAEYVHPLYDSAAAMSAEEKASVVAELHPNL